MEVNFETLRDEALAGVELEPIKIQLPGRGKPVVIPGVPTGLFLTTFDSDDASGDKLIASCWRFLEAVIPPKDWGRVSDWLKGEPAQVTVKLADVIMAHFNLTFSNAELPKESEDSDE